MRNHAYITMLAGLLCCMSSIPLFACWQIGTGYSQVRTDHLVFAYANHGKPVIGAHFELHNANWADGAPDDQSRVPQGPSRLPRWQASVLQRGVTNAHGILDLGEVSPGKYYVVGAHVTNGKSKPWQGFAIEVSPRVPAQKSQTLWLNYYADGCTELLATDDGGRPAFTMM
jgi:hypothetical protein